MFSKLQLAVMALVLMIPLGACDTGADPAFGSVSILLTDAPGELSEAWVTITDIYLQGQTGESDPPASRVYLLQDGEETHELLSLANKVAELVADEVIPAGTYGQLRVIMSGGCVIDDGVVFASSDSYAECGERDGLLVMPSFEQTGAKVLLHGITVTGGQKVLVLDFHVGQSFTAGASGNYVLTPVIHGAELQLTVGVDVTLSAGEVELPEGTTLGDFSATLTPDEGDASTVPFEEVDGVFRAAFRYLVPENGPFEVQLDVPDGVSVAVSPPSPQVVDPTSGQTATIAWVLEHPGD
jgi:hypothetical protein